MHLTSLGRSPSDAERDAVPILRAELRNDPRLTPEQADPYRCLICGQGEAPGRVLVPVLTPVPDRHLWLHLNSCHAEHMRRQAEKAEACLRTAGLREAGAQGRIVRCDCS